MNANYTYFDDPAKCCDALHLTQNRPGHYQRGAQSSCPVSGTHQRKGVAYVF